MATKKRLVYASEVEEIFNYIEHESSDSYKAFQVAIEKATTVDAREVVHGRWIPIRNKIHGYYMGLLCSECGHKATNKGGNYCPNCGAKMDGDGNG